MPTVKDTIDRLQRSYKPDEHIAVAIWCESDVIDRAEKLGTVVTQEEAQDILDTIDRKQDCSVGVSWDTLDAFIDECIANRSEEDSHGG